MLMICYYFPPIAGIGSLRALKFATHLPEFGWVPTVVAPRGGGDEDPSLSAVGVRARRTRLFQLGRVKRVLRNRSAGSAGNRAPGRWRERIRRWLYYPDGQIGWYPFAVAGGRRVIREDGCDVIFSSSFPITAHLVARRLHRETGIPWVAEFRDLWTDWGGEGRGRHRLNGVIERSILGAATAVVTVSPTYGEVLRSRGAKCVSIVTNGFDPADFCDEKVPDGAMAAYVGTYYPEYQDLETALRALGDLVRSGSISRGEVRFVGNVPAGLGKILAGSGIADSVCCTGFVPHTEALRQICGANVLLLSGPTTASRDALRGHIPAKTFEYIGSGRSILFVGDPRSDVANLLRPLSSVRIVEPGNVEAAKAAILSLLQSREARSPTQVERFGSRSLAKKLADVLDCAAYKSASMGE